MGVSLLRAALTMQSARMVWAEGEPNDVGATCARAASPVFTPRARGTSTSRPTRRTSGRRCAPRSTCPNWRATSATTRCASARSTPPRSFRSCAPRLAARTALEWEELFGEEVPCAAARTVEDMFDNEQVLAEDDGGDLRAPHARLVPRLHPAGAIRPYAGARALCRADAGQHTAGVLAAQRWTNRTRLPITWCPTAAALGTPASAAPEGACDAHMHVYDRRFGAARAARCHARSRHRRRLPPAAATHRHAAHGSRSAARPRHGQQRDAGRHSKRLAPRTRAAWRWYGPR